MFVFVYSAVSAAFDIIADGLLPKKPTNLEGHIKTLEYCVEMTVI